MSRIAEHLQLYHREKTASKLTSLWRAGKALTSKITPTKVKDFFKPGQNSQYGGPATASRWQNSTKDFLPSSRTVDNVRLGQTPWTDLKKHFTQNDYGIWSPVNRGVGDIARNATSGATSGVFHPVTGGLANIGEENWKNKDWLGMSKDVLRNAAIHGLAGAVGGKAVTNRMSGSTAGGLTGALGDYFLGTGNTLTNLGSFAGLTAPRFGMANTLKNYTPESLLLRLANKKNLTRAAVAGSVGGPGLMMYNQVTGAVNNVNDLVSQAKETLGPYESVAKGISGLSGIGGMLGGMSPYLIMALLGAGGGGLLGGGRGALAGGLSLPLLYFLLSQGGMGNGVGGVGGGAGEGELNPGLDNQTESLQGLSSTPEGTEGNLGPLATETPVGGVSDNPVMNELPL